MISVCIATYNGGKTIHTQLASILSQLGENDEVVISDDHSTDNTLDIIRAFNSPIVRIVEGPVKGSPIPNFENALQHSKGDIIFLADQDDKWVENKVETMVRHIQEGAACVVSDCYVTDKDFNITHPSFYQEVGTRAGFFYNLFVHNYYLGCCMAFTREVLIKSLPFPANIPMHDIWIGNVAALFFNVKFIPEPLIYFCRHGNNSSSTAAPSPYSLWEKVRFRLDILLPLTNRWLGLSRTTTPAPNL